MISWPQQNNYLLQWPDPDLPNPPKTLVLFDKGMMVWLSNANDFANFTELTFEAYEKLDQLDQDIHSWEQASEKLKELTGDDLNKKLLDAWYKTEFA